MIKFTYIVIFLFSIAIVSCDKEAKRDYEMSGIYYITDLTQLEYRDGELTEEESYDSIGVLKLRYSTSGSVLEDNGEFILHNTSAPIKAFDELGGHYEFSWSSGWDDKRLTFVYTDLLSTYGLTFTITKNKPKRKELLFVYTQTDSTGVLTEFMELYTLEKY